MSKTIQPPFFIQQGIYLHERCSSLANAYEWLNGVSWEAAEAGAEPPTDFVIEHLGVQHSVEWERVFDQDHHPEAICQTLEEALKPKGDFVCLYEEGVKAPIMSSTDLGEVLDFCRTSARSWMPGMRQRLYIVYQDRSYPIRWAPTEAGAEALEPTTELERLFAPDSNLLRLRFEHVAIGRGDVDVVELMSSTDLSEVLDYCRERHGFWGSTKEREKLYIVFGGQRYPIRWLEVFDARGQPEWEPAVPTMLQNFFASQLNPTKSITKSPAITSAITSAKGTLAELSDLLPITTSNPTISWTSANHDHAVVDLNDIALSVAFSTAITKLTKLIVD